MSALMWAGLLVGFLVIGPLFCWIVGLMNPIGWMGYPPWRVPQKAWDAHRANRLYFPSDYERDTRRTT